METTTVMTLEGEEAIGMTDEKTEVVVKVLADQKDVVEKNHAKDEIRTGTKMMKMIVRKSGIVHAIETYQETEMNLGIETAGTTANARNHSAAKTEAETLLDAMTAETKGVVTNLEEGRNGAIEREIGEETHHQTAHQTAQTVKHLEHRGTRRKCADQT